MSDLREALHELSLAIKETEKQNNKIIKMVALLENTSHNNALNYIQKRKYLKNVEACY